MASGSSGRTTNSASKAFDFASDDILCSYEDYGARDGTSGNHSDPSIAANSGKEFHKSRMARGSVFPASYSPPEESYNQDVISTVESTMKKYSDNIMRFLEGISSRLSQLELYCYNLDKSIGEMRSDLVRDHEGSEAKLKYLEKHMQEVHRSVQILRDKQELADTQKELAKLQLAHKESSSAGNNSLQNKENASLPASESKASEHSSDSHDQQLALVPHQAATQPTLPAQPVDHQQSPMPPPSTMPPQTLPPPGHAYYLHPAQTNPVAAQSQPSQGQYQPAASQIQDPSRMAAPQLPAQSPVNQNSHVQPIPSYPPQWPHQLQQPGQPPQQAVMQPQIRGSSQVVYSNYLPSQSNQPSAEMAPNSMPMQVPFGGASQTVPAGSEPPAYGFVASGRPPQPQLPSQHVKPGYNPTQPGDGYVHSGPHPALPPGNAYMMYDGEGGRMHHPPPPQSHYQQNTYPLNNIQLQNPQRMPNNPNIAVSHSMRSHPYNELIEKLVSMGYRGDHVVGIIQRLEESGQPIDFNSVLDRLNGHSQPSGGPQRGWSVSTVD
ncbi:actin cytoskeleton-regulatory complex protein pan1-like isoform X2 [Andrographis paniculata]|uniref:actin cytoskeleton-regulatory complex protein pan1-like isoform X2 n=1 Tax=Andrographis paniculata TaxID=175694 RepID=UPI0021E78E10|nr:actin cytoskeleton-regulatory complex protein pan1-like isoform X2 [Andrographis paniculata]